jgi:tetratricopeptide (TPR) repeat protein
MFTLTEAEKSFEFDFEMAGLDLEAERYVDAENRFNQIARQVTSPASYLGIGLTKLGRYVDGETNANEIIYCFKKARDLVDNKEDVAQLTAQVTLKTLEQLYGIIIDNVFKDREAEARERKAQLGILVSAVVIGATKRGSTGKVAGGSLAAFSTLNMFAQRKNRVTSKGEIIICLKKIIDLNHETFEFIEEYEVIKENYLATFAKMKEEADYVALPDEQRTNKKIEIANKERSTTLPSESPFYSYRESAFLNFEKKEFRAALNSINAALLIYPNDAELLNLIQQCFSEWRAKDKKMFWLLFWVGLILSFVAMGAVSSNNAIYSSELYQNIMMSPLCMLIVYPIVGTLFNQWNHEKRIRKYHSAIL